MRAIFGPQGCPHCRAAYIWKTKHKKPLVIILLGALFSVALASHAPPHVARWILLLGNITMAGVGIYALADAELRPVQPPMSDHNV
jgi:hypothetical protein